MGLARTYRFIEGSLVVLSFIQATRAVFGLTLNMLGAALVTHQVDLLLVNAHLMLLVAVVLPWFTPRVRSALPETLSIAAILAVVARIGVSVQVPLLRIVAGTAVIGMSGVYFVALLRANWRTWVSVVMIGTPA